MLAGNRYPLLGVTEKPDSPGREGSREVTNRIELISSLHGSHRCQHWQTAALLPGGLGRNLQPLVLLLGLLWSMSRGIHPYTRHTRTTFRFKGKMVTMTLYARQQKRHRCKKQSFLDSVGEGESGIIWEGSVESYILSHVKRIAGPGLMHETGCSGLVHWDDAEGWDGEGHGGGVQDGEHMCAHGWFRSMYGKNHYNIVK